ncbi:MAG: DUF2807 domain-containing protein [Coxiellaceae bacterium]|nr:DUF2807 domain-containing protein [Coxiellaceae bacterium]
MLNAKRLCTALLSGLLLLVALTASAGKIEHGKLGRQLSKDHERMPASRDQTFQLSPFYAIVANGNIDLFIHGSKAYQSVTLQNYHDYVNRGKKNKQEVPVLWVDNGVLYIDNENWMNKGETMHIDVNVKDLNGLFVTGNILVVGDHIISNGMAIDDDSTRNVNLDGKMTVNWLNSRGSGNIDIGWIQSHHMQMLGTGSGMIRLAGVVHDMRVRLYNKQQYAGQYLRTNNLMVATREHADASVFANNTLETFAYDWSNIFYYTTPNSLNRMTVQSGNVMQADWRM